MRFYKFIAAILFSTAFLAGCFSVPEYPDTPQIEYHDINNYIRLDQVTGGYKDSVVISIRFKDGDGDLGYAQWEIDSLAKQGGGHNFIVTQYRKVGNQYVVYTPNESLSGYFHRLSSDKPGPIEGLLHYNGVQVYHSFYPYAKDSVRFDVTIRDRAGNLSNTIQTESVMLRSL